MCVNPATFWVIDVNIAPEELPQPLSVEGFFCGIGEMFVNHSVGCFFRGAICAIRVFKSTLLNLAISTNDFFKFGYLFIGVVICNKSPPVSSFDLPAVSFELPSGCIVISPCVFGVTKIWGEASFSLEPSPMSEIGSDSSYFFFELGTVPIPPARGSDGIADLSSFKSHVAFVTEVLGDQKGLSL